MSLTEYLHINGFDGFEGYCQQIPKQVTDLITLSSQPNIKIMEIGFNAGHSSEIFLKYNDTSTVISFDIGLHNYTSYGKEYIDNMYPNRHKLIIGDSRITIPKYYNENNDKFDLIFIDGGHDYDIAKTDIENCYHLSHINTIIIIDDVVYNSNFGYTIGPTKAWLEYVSNNKFSNLDIKKYNDGRGMVWGKYVFK
jgi:predicted O-methyltransferase YrrM